MKCEVTLITTKFVFQKQAKYLFNEVTNESGIDYDDELNGTITINSHEIKIKFSISNINNESV